MSENAWSDQLSQPTYGVSVHEDVRIPMRDGVHLAADLYVPDASGEFPVLLSMSPYGKGVQKLPVPEFPSNSKLGNGGIEAGNTEYFVGRGYAHLIVDCRGTGGSEGAYTFLGPEEYRDGHDAIEWAAEQPWCDENAGMLGTSYFSMIQYGIAAERPPHLKAMFAIDALTDLYRHWAYHGGILSHGFMMHWWPQVLAHTVADLPIDDEERERRVKELKADLDIRSYPSAYLPLELPEKNRHLFDMLLNPNDGAYYWERSGSTRLDMIDVPCYLLTRWPAWALHLPGAFAAYESIDAPKKLEIMIPESGSGFNRPWLRDCHDTVLRWYDHWLKGIDTGVMDEPPIKLFIQGADVFRFEHAWPLRRTEWTKFYLREGSQLSTGEPEAEEPPDVFRNNPAVKPGDVIPCLTYTTDPFDAAVEITGPVAAYVFASIDAEDTNWIVELRVVSPQGTCKTISIGWLKASHREIDEGRSRPWQPWHPHVAPTPVPSGETFEYAIELRETSFVVPQGHSLQFIIKGQDAPWEGREYYHEVFTHLPNAREVGHQVFHTPAHASHVLVPVIPASTGTDDSRSE